MISKGKLVACLVAGGIALSGIARAATSPEDCRENFQEFRRQVSALLVHIEQEFIQLRWAAEKNRELVYGPLWEAGRLKRDTYSESRVARGDVLYVRYQNWAESYREDAEQAAAAVEGFLTELKTRYAQPAQLCEIPKFADCMLSWNELNQEKVQRLDKVLRGYAAEEMGLMRRVGATVTETPSEHHDFADRYHAELVDRQERFYPEILTLLREIRESIEFDGPESCCDVCRIRNLPAVSDPVGVKIKKDLAESSTGAQGDVIPKNPVARAFEERERSDS